METINAIEVKGLWAAYEDRMIIEDMNLKIPKGKHHDHYRCKWLRKIHIIKSDFKDFARKTGRSQD